MGKVESSKFIRWEGEIYRLDDIVDDGIELFVFRKGSWEPISSKLTATVLYEGIEVPDPEAYEVAQNDFAKHKLYVQK